MNPNTLGSQVYFDPFAEGENQHFDPIASFESLRLNYEQGKVEHDTVADEFVRQAEALWLDAKFVDRFDAVTAIAQQMHRMCGDDPNLRSVFENSSIFGSVHSENDSHNHASDSFHSHDEDDGEEEDEEEDEEVVSIFGFKISKKRKNSR